MDFILGELFCGPGGMALGAGLAGQSHPPIIDSKGEKYTIHHLWGVDKDVDAIETYKANVARRFGGVGISTDAFEFVRSMTEEQKSINALAFGFPCNDFSLVGDQTGLSGKYGTLYKAGISVIDQTNPLWFIAENVSGIHSADGGKALKKILSELQDAGQGYTITAHLYKFEEYGVPQYRHRFIIVGIRNDLNLKFYVPAPTTPNPEQQKTVFQALQNIPTNAPNNEIQRMNKTVVMRLKLTPPWRNAWFLEELEAMSPNQRRNVLQETPWYQDVFSTKTDDEILNMIKSSRLHCTKAKMSHIYRRLDANRPSYTITGSGGGGTHVYHWCEHRSLSNRERARIQTFPDDFVFHGTTEKVRKQIGMAVPTEGAKIIFTHILKTFAHIPYKKASSEYDIQETLSLPDSSGHIEIPSSKSLMHKINDLLGGRPRFCYSNHDIITVQGRDNKTIVFACQGTSFTMVKESILKAAELFQSQKFVSERTLQLHYPEYFPTTGYNSFLAIDILDRLKLGEKKQPYRKSNMWVLYPPKR